MSACGPGTELCDPRFVQLRPTRSDAIEYRDKHVVWRYEHGVRIIVSHVHKLIQVTQIIESDLPTGFTGENSQHQMTIHEDVETTVVATHCRVLEYI